MQILSMRVQSSRKEVPKRFLRTNVSEKCTLDMFTVRQKTSPFPTPSQRRCGMVLIGLDHLQLTVTIRVMFAFRICCTEDVPVDCFDYLCAIVRGVE